MTKCSSNFSFSWIEIYPFLIKGFFSKISKLITKTRKISNYITEADDLEAVKTYIYLKVKIIFDPPLSGTVMEALKQTISELEWRLNVNAESKGG